jgi:uncharacterized membrane protein
LPFGSILPTACILMAKRKGPEFGLDEKIALWVICIFHLAGVLLLSFGRGQIYQIALDFVPINLVLTSLLVLKFQKEFSGRFWQFLALAFFGGLVAEIIGVNTGLIFGNYRYGPVLGPGFLNTPILIGLNWFLVSYTALCLCDYLTLPSWARLLAAVFLLTGLDYLIEPVAMRLGFWEWADGTVPLKNYLGWAAVGTIILAGPTFYSFRRKNRVAALSFLIQCLFFVLMNIF